MHLFPFSRLICSPTPIPLSYTPQSIKFGSPIPYTSLSLPPDYPSLLKYSSIMDVPGMPAHALWGACPGAILPGHPVGYVGGGYMWVGV